MADGKHTIIVFDIKKKFDTAWKYGIVKNLQEHGIRGNMQQFIKNFLANRQVKVCINKTYSSIKEGKGLRMVAHSAVLCF